MGLFKGKKEKRPRPQGGHMEIYVMCDRCGEVIKTHIVTAQELMPTYDEQGPAYLLKKELIGSRCPNKILISVYFDHAKRILSKEIAGGTFQDMKAL